METKTITLVVTDEHRARAKELLEKYHVTWVHVCPIVQALRDIGMYQVNVGAKFVTDLSTDARYVMDATGTHIACTSMWDSLELPSTVTLTLVQEVFEHGTD